MPDMEPCQKRRKVTTLILTDGQELELVGWYETLLIFYNQRLKEFKLKDKKDRLMSEKANELFITLLDLKTWMNYMWTTYMYGRLARQNKSGEHTKRTARQNWILQHFDFLSPHFVVRNQTRQLVSVSFYIFYLLVFINIFSLINVHVCIVIFKLTFS